MGGQCSDFGSLLWCFDCFISENFEKFTGKIMWMVWTVASSHCYPWWGIFKFGGNSFLFKATSVFESSWEDPLEKGMATHSSILAWRIPWTEKPGGLQSVGLQRDATEWLTLLTTTAYYTRNLNVWFLILIIPLFNLTF